MPEANVGCRGEIRLQVDAFFRGNVRSVLLCLGAGVLLIAATGCHREPGADVVATVNGKEILRSDLEKLYKADLTQESPQDPSPEQANIVRLNILQHMIDDEILQQRAAKLNLAASDEDVNAQLTEMKALSTEEEFNQQLKQRGLTLDDLKRDIRRRLTRTKVVNKEIESKINITDAEITSYYNSHKPEFNLIEPQYHLAEIVVTGQPPQQGTQAQPHRPMNEAEARKEIQSIHSRIESGEDFATIASQLSENANSAPNGGDMGFVTESQLHSDTDVYTAISRLKPGQITDSLPRYDSSVPGHKVLAFAIFKLIGREPAGQRELNDPRVQQSIRQGLRERKGQLLRTAYFEMLHNDAKIHNYFAEQILKQGAQ